MKALQACIYQLFLKSPVAKSMLILVFKTKYFNFQAQAGERGGVALIFKPMT